MIQRLDAGKLPCEHDRGEREGELFLDPDGHMFGTVEHETPCLRQRACALENRC
jgi:hypothetical protein